MQINVEVLHALAERPRSLMDLRREAGSPPPTTMRGHMRTLTETGVLVRQRQNSFPGALDYELTPAGHELVVVTRALQDWLANSPGKPLELGTAAAKSAIKALVEGWSTNILRALAAKPLSLTELDRLISSLNYPSLERRLGAMRTAGQIEAAPSPGRGTPYTVTDWLRRAVAPLAAAAQWERLNAPETTLPISRLDIEAAFLLAIPLIDPPPDLSGTCRLAVQIQTGNGEQLAGVLVVVEEGEIVSCATSHQGQADAWASGSASTWLRAVIEHDTDRLEMGGDCHLTRGLLDGLHGSLFGMQRPS